jgi:hypothetical protein
MPSSWGNGIPAGAREHCQEIFRNPEVLAVDFDVPKVPPFEIPALQFYPSRIVVPDPRELFLLPPPPPCELCQPPYVLFLPERSLEDAGYIYANFGSVPRDCLPQRLLG